MSRYYPIDEQAARLSHEMMSMSDYQEGWKTAEYRQLVDIAGAMAEREKKRKPDYAEAIDHLLDRYASKMAEWMNTESRIGTMCPSVLIAGGDGVSARRKEKQNRRMDAHMGKRAQIDRLLDRMRSIGTGGIAAGDANALVKLEAKRDDLVELQERMKEVNAYFRKHKTLDGCAILTPEQIERLKASMVGAWHSEAPYPSYLLSNNNAEIRRIEKRIKEINETKTAGDRSYPADGVDGLQVVEDTGIMRIQLVFDGKPDEPVRDILKAWGFRWAPSQNAWQRLLNQNGRYAAKMAIEKIAALEQ